MSDTTDPTPRGGHTVDLSSNAARGTRPRRSTPKGFAPVVQQTINLSTKKESRLEAPKPEAKQPEAPKPNAQPKREPRRDAQAPRGEKPRGGNSRGGQQRHTAPRDAPRGAPPPSGGTSLADLLDEATLARLRGGT